MTTTDLQLPAQYATGDVLVRAAEVKNIDADKGLVDVRLMQYEHEAQVEEDIWEVFARGAFKAATGNPSRVKVSDQGHNRAVVIGQATQLRDEEDGLYGTLRIADTTHGRDVLTLLQPGPDGEPAVLDQLSVEFRAQKRHMQVIRRTGSLLIRHERAVLCGISPVGAGAYGDGSRVLAVRAEAADRRRERAIAELMALQAGSNLIP